MPINISSKDNERVKYTKSLLKSKNRQKESKYIIEGYRILTLAIECNADLDYVFINESFEDKEEHKRFLTVLEEKNIRVFKTTNKIFKELVDTENTQGILGVIKFKDKNIYEVLEMRVEEALTFFENFPKIKNKLQMLSDVGLSYIKLGQPAPTLSGGEAARVKLAKELQKKPTGKSLFILDEPTTGLHSDDIKKLLVILNRIVDNGDTVLVIEHNLDVIKVADYIIDLGPEGGDKGGNIVAVGTPEEIAKVKESYTGQYLKKYLN